MIPPTSSSTRSPGESAGSGSAPSGAGSSSPTPLADIAYPPSTSATPALTDFLDLETLQAIQDGFAAVTRLSTVIRDADGQALTRPTDVQQQVEGDAVLDFLINVDEADTAQPLAPLAPAETSTSTEPSEPMPAPDPPEAAAVVDDAGAGAFVAPIVVAGQTLGSIVIEPSPQALSEASRDRLRTVAQELGVPEDQVDALMLSAEQACGPNRAAGVQFLYLLANSVARLCYQEHQIRQRVEELSTLYRLSTVMAGRRDLQEVLDTAAQSAAEAMKVKAASVRLLDDHERELVAKSIYNLSPTYLSKGPLTLSKSTIYQQALAGEIVYVEDLPTDPRVIYPDYAKREGLVSMLVAPMIYQGRRIGVVQLFTGEKRKFRRFEKQLLLAVAQVLAAAIENARLDAEFVESQRVQRQLHMATKVQQRMLPHDVPHIPPFDVAARYVPTFELGGDFYDFIDLDGNLGIAVGDVVGKGIAASLLMASVRASLRAYAQDVYDIDEIISRVNVALSRDTLDNEFATLFYGVLDSESRRFTYCNAGHEPPLLLRDGEFLRMQTGGMIVGIDARQTYRKALIDLKTGDVMCVFSDGLLDAQNAEGERFGRDRLRAAMLDVDADASSDEILNHIVWQMRRFVGLRESVDDLTIVVVKVGE